MGVSSRGLTPEHALDVVYVLALSLFDTFKEQRVSTCAWLVSLSHSWSAYLRVLHEIWPFGTNMLEGGFLSIGHVISPLLLFDSD